MKWADVQKEMSIAGSPEKITSVGQGILTLIAEGINVHSIPELTNMQFALQRVIAELKTWEKIERDRQRIL